MKVIWYILSAILTFQSNNTKWSLEPVHLASGGLELKTIRIVKPVGCQLGLVFHAEIKLEFMACDF